LACRSIHFGRSSSPQNHALTQHFYRKLNAAGLIEERELAQICRRWIVAFSRTDMCLGPVRTAASIWPGAIKCDGCGNLIDPTELISPRSALSGDTHWKFRTSRHLFLRQSLLLDELNEWVDGRSGWPPFVVSLAKSWLTLELKDAASRRSRLGHPGAARGVRTEGVLRLVRCADRLHRSDSGMGRSRQSSRDWRQWWLEADNVRYIQFPRQG